MTVVHPIPHAWLTAGGTGARNYDEFAGDAEITAIIEQNPYSALAVEMPHCAPGAQGRDFFACLPDAAARLEQAKSAGAYREVGAAVVLYRISGPDSTPAYGLFCLVDTDQISTAADEPGLVIRNEDVFAHKVRERVALAEATGHLLSPVLLLKGDRAAAGGGPSRLHAALAAACDAAGAPAAVDVDHAGRTHAIWPLPPGPDADRLCALAGDSELVVADGNHRSLAAQLGRLDRFLAVVTTPESVRIDGYHRLVGPLPISPVELVNRLVAAGAAVEELPDRPGQPAARGTVHLYGAGRGWAVRLPATPGAGEVDNLDHALVERLVLATPLGLDPGDKRITYVGGDYPASWLHGEVDAGRADLAILIAPVTVDDFLAVNLARHKLPRKSTWFTPKARAGLVVAQL
ncbi:DUF1015 family protein [Pilimelia anulata]|nr:DUF1015 family protein [Pilimelia anulata]